MKTYVLFFLLVSMASGCGTNDNKFNDDRVPDDLKALYREDAIQLALDELLEKTGDPEISLPEDLIDKYYRALVAVFNADGVPNRDKVIETYDIHAHKRADPHSVLVTVDRSYSWTDAWQSGVTLTGNPSIDDLLETYELILVNYHDATNLAVLETEKALNPFALAARFDAIPGVLFSDPNGYAGDGNNILAVRDGETVRLTYSLGWGDCPAGCIYRHHWQFVVVGASTVNFLDEFGDPLP